MERNVGEGITIFELDSVSVDLEGSILTATIHGSDSATRILLAADDKGTFSTERLHGKVNTIHYISKKDFNQDRKRIFCTFEQYQALGRPLEMDQIVDYKNRAR